MMTEMIELSEHCSMHWKAPFVWEEILELSCMSTEGEDIEGRAL